MTSDRSRVGPAIARATVGGLAGMLASLVGLGAGWAAYSALALDHEVHLPAAIDAERRTFRSGEAGEISYYVAPAQTGRPLVLVHSINAAASAYEMRPLFEAYRGKRPVYALDLPGFGFSERADRHYSPPLFTAALTDLIAGQVREAGPVDLVA